MIDNRALQTALKERGFDPGPVDGIISRRTIAAVAAFQKAEGLDIKWPGTIGPKTLEALFGKKKQEISPLVGKPWFDMALTKKGLHEKRDNAELKEFLKSDGSTLGDPSKLPWCFAGEVEILTEDGWQRFDRLSAGRVWQVDESGKASLSGYLPVEKDYNGEAHQIEGSTFQGVCDKDHQWWGSWSYETRQRLESPDRKGTLDQLTTAGLRIPRVETEAWGVNMTDEQITLLAAFISDGYVHRGKLEFAVSRERKLQALAELNPDHVYRNKTAYGRSTTPLTNYTFEKPEWFDGVFSEYKRLTREFINGLSKAQCGVFLNAYAQFDGNVRADGRITLYTSDDGMRDDLIQIAALAGYWPRIEKGGRSELTKKASWRIGFMPTTDRRNRIRKEDVSLINYTGKMYCVTVPQGRIIVRGRNMTPCVTGNCGDLIQTCIALTLPGEQIPINPYLARNWMKFGKEIKPTLGAILVFWRGSRTGFQGHVGFYAGESLDGKKLYVLGGNQSDMISVAPLGADRLLGARWPLTAPTPDKRERPLMIGGKLSINEA